MSKHYWIGAVALALLGGSSVWAQDPGAQPEGPHVLIRGNIRGNRAEVREGEYSLGVGLTRPSGELRAQLNLPDEQGLVVEAVVPGSPADKGGLKQFDVLMKAGATPLTNLRDLASEIEKAKEGKMAIELLRGGKTQTVTVTPEKRSTEGPGKIIVRAGPKNEEGNVFWFNNPLSPEGPGGPMFFLHPAQILPPGAPLPPSAAKDVHVTIKTEGTLPDGYKVEIVRVDKELAKITVRRGEEKWEATEGKLDKLPEKIRPEVQRLGGGSLFFKTFPPEFGPTNLSGTVTFGSAPGVEVRALGSDPQILQRLEEMSRKLEELNNKFKKLEQMPTPELPTAKPPAEKPGKEPEKKSAEPPAAGRRI